MTAKKKIWSVYEVGASYEGPLTEVEASSESRALASASAYYGVSRKKLYTIPTGGRWERPGPTRHSSHATKLTILRTGSPARGRKVSHMHHHSTKATVMPRSPLGALDGMLDGTRITLTNAESLVRAHVPDAIVDTHHAFRHAKKTYWIHRESFVASIGQGPTKNAAWKDAALRLSLLPTVR